MKPDAFSSPLAFILVFTPDTGRKKKKRRASPPPQLFSFLFVAAFIVFVLTLVAHQRRYSFDWVLIRTLCFLRLCTSVPT